MITPGRYRHFKGGLYTVHAIATHSETNEQLVVYSNTDGKHFVRPVSMFEETVNVDGEEKPRFERLDGET